MTVQEALLQGTRLLEEAAVLRFDALLAAGRSEAVAEGQKFLRSYPRSAYAQRVRANYPPAQDVLDFAEFPTGSVTQHTTTLCLACIFRLFTKQLGLAPRTAYNEIRRYAPTVGGLTSRNPQRPFFKPSEEKNPHCPYCEAPRRWAVTRC